MLTVPGWQTRCDAFEAEHPDIPEMVAIRFWRRVEVTDDCWIWRGATQRTKPSRPAYGAYGGLPGRTHNPAHRVAWEIHNGPIPAGMVIDHTCRNTLCVRPDHLQVTTIAHNVALGWERMTPDETTEARARQRRSINLHNREHMMDAIRRFRLSHPHLYPAGSPQTRNP